jgi:hypothetical protein
MQHRDVVVQKYRWLVPVWNQKLVFNIAGLFEVGDCLVNWFGVSWVEQLQVGKVAVELAVNDHVVDRLNNFIDFHHFVFGITNPSFFDECHSRIASHEILKVNRVLTKPEPAMQMKKSLVIVFEQMINARHVAVNGHHLDWVMSQPNKNAQRFLKSLESLFVRMPVKVYDTCQEGDFVVVVNLWNGHLVAEIEQPLEDSQCMAWTGVFYQQFTEHDLDLDWRLVL